MIVIAKEVMETETDTLQAQEEDIIPKVKTRTLKTTATDVDAMIVIGPVGMTIGTGKGTETGRGAVDIVMRDHGAGHPRLKGRGTGWQDQIDRGNVNETVKAKDEQDGLHHLVDDSYIWLLRIS